MTTITVNNDSPAFLGSIAEDRDPLPIPITAEGLLAATSPVDQNLFEPELRSSRGYRGRFPICRTRRSIYGFR